VGFGGCDRNRAACFPGHLLGSIGLGGGVWGGGKTSAFRGPFALYTDMPYIGNAISPVNQGRPFYSEQYCITLISLI